MKIGLVLEGGAMRGLYTAGILDCFIDDNVEFNTVIGVSAGSVFGVNLLSKQKGRVLNYNKEFCNDKRYMGIKSLIKTGNIVNKEFAYYEVPFKLHPFDDKTYNKSKTDFYSVMTNIETGEPEYTLIKNASKQIEELRASSSMPFVSKPVEINNNKYLDGALGDSIPILKCKELGCDKIIVVLTRPKDYRKKKSNQLLPKLFYRKYPNLIKAINNRYNLYNETLDIIEELESKKEILVLRPSKKIKIKRIEKNKNKLQEMYDLGVKDYKKMKKKINNYLYK